MFTAEQSSRLPRLHVYGAQLGSFGKTTLPVGERIVNNNAANFWPDLLTTYTDGASMFSCPKLSQPAVNGPGGGTSNRCALGIGINCSFIDPNSGDAQAGTGYTWTLLSSVPEPSRVVWFADAAGEVKGPWKSRVEVAGTGSCFFRGNISNGQCVSPRHGGKINVAFADGHISLVNPSEIDWGARDPGGSYIGYTQF